MRPTLFAKSARPFLEAELRSLVITSFEIAPEKLRPYLPPGVELDMINDKTFVSLVGMVFGRPRLWGVIHAPFHHQFEQVNLRFYVVRRTSEGKRNGVVFIQEIVPRVSVAWAARRVYGENYVRLPMKSLSDPATETGSPGAIEYRWRYENRWMGLLAGVQKEEIGTRPDAVQTFVSHRPWGYSLQEDGTCLEYRVAHPPWRLRKVAATQVTGDMSALWGTELGNVLSGPPEFSVWVHHSSFTVYPPSLCMRT